MYLALIRLPLKSMYLTSIRVLHQGIYLAPIRLLHKDIYYINCRVRQGFPALRKAVTTHVKKKILYFFTCVDKGQSAACHSPLAPLGQVDG